MLYPMSVTLLRTQGITGHLNNIDIHSSLFCISNEIPEKMVYRQQFSCLTPGMLSSKSQRTAGGVVILSNQTGNGVYDTCCLVLRKALKKDTNIISLSLCYVYICARPHLFQQSAVRCALISQHHGSDAGRRGR